MSQQRGYVNGGNFYSNIAKPIKIDCQFTVTPTNGLGITSLKSNGYVRNVFMHTSTTPSSNDGYLNPNPASGYALIQLKNNFNSYLGAIPSWAPPVTGSNINISDSSVLTVGSPYVITAVGAVPAAHFAVVTVADSSGSLAGTYFKVSDAFGNNYVLYNVVSGVGSPPALTGALANYVAVPVAFATNAANTAVATALSTSIAALNGSNSFSTSVGGHTVTVTSLVSNQTIVPPPVDVNTGFSVSAVTFTSLQADWQSVGLPQGLTPAVGQSFIATATGSALGTGTVKTPGTSAISAIEVIGTPNSSIATSSIASFGGAWLLLRFLGASISGTFTGSALGTHTHDLKIIGGQAASTTNDVAVYSGPILGKEAATDSTILGANSATAGGVVAASAGTPAGTISATATFGATAPTTGSIISMSLYFDGSSVTVDGL